MLKRKKRSEYSNWSCKILAEKISVEKIWRKISEGFTQLSKAEHKNSFSRNHQFELYARLRRHTLKNHTFSHWVVILTSLCHFLLFVFIIKIFVVASLFFFVAFRLNSFSLLYLQYKSIHINIIVCLSSMPSLYTYLVVLYLTLPVFRHCVSHILRFLLKAVVDEFAAYYKMSAFHSLPLILCWIRWMVFAFVAPFYSKHFIA